MELLLSYRRQWSQQTLLVLFAAAAFFSCPAMAQQTTSGVRWFDQDTMTGDWGGERTSLRDAGIDLRAHFTTESAGILTVATIRRCVIRSRLTSARISTSID